MNKIPAREIARIAYEACRVLQSDRDAEPWNNTPDECSERATTYVCDILAGLPDHIIHTEWMIALQALGWANPIGGPGSYALFKGVVESLASDAEPWELYNVKRPCGQLRVVNEIRITEYVDPDTGRGGVSETFWTDDAEPMPIFKKLGLLELTKTVASIPIIQSAPAGFSVDS